MKKRIYKSPKSRAILIDARSLICHSPVQEQMLENGGLWVEETMGEAVGDAKQRDVSNDLYWNF